MIATVITNRECSAPSAETSMLASVPRAVHGERSPSRSGIDETAADRVARQLDPVAHPELGEYVLAVALDRALADVQQMGDLVTGVRLRDELDDLLLADREI